MAEQSKLVQTKNAFKVVGRVSRIDRDGAFKEDIMNKVGNKHHGDTYRSLRFGVKTSDSNEITVQMFDYEPEQIFAWNSDKKKADSSYKGDWIPFGQWEANPEMYREQGYAILQTRVGFEYGEDGKLVTHGVPSYVASQQIFENLSNGDAVVVEGEIRYSKFKNRNNEEVEQKTYTIKKCFKLKNVDFEAEDFEEVTYFEQEMVFVGADIDKKEGKVYVTGRMIDFTKKFHDSQFIVQFKDAEGKTDAGMVKLAEAFAKRFKFGDVVKVFGDTINRVIIEENEEEAPVEEEKDLFAEFGGKKKPKHAQQQKFTQRSYVQEMQIYGIEGYTAGVYEEDDFVEQNLMENKDDFASEFGGKSKKKNPFDLGEADDINEEDLPF
jgi:hypothetical protein